MYRMLFRVLFIISLICAFTNAQVPTKLYYKPNISAFDGNSSDWEGIPRMIFARNSRLPADIDIVNMQLAMTNEPVRDYRGEPQPITDTPPVSLSVLFTQRGSPQYYFDQFHRFFIWNRDLRLCLRFDETPYSQFGASVRGCNSAIPAHIFVRMGLLSTIEVWECGPTTCAYSRSRRVCDQGCAFVPLAENRAICAGKCGIASLYDNNIEITVYANTFTNILQKYTGSKSIANIGVFSISATVDSVDPSPDEGETQVFMVPDMQIITPTPTPTIPSTASPNGDNNANIADEGNIENYNNYTDSGDDNENNPSINVAITADNSRTDKCAQNLSILILSAMTFSIVTVISLIMCVAICVANARPFEPQA